MAHPFTCHCAQPASIGPKLRRDVEDRYHAPWYTWGTLVEGGGK